VKKKALNILYHLTKHPGVVSGPFEKRIMACWLAVFDKYWSRSL